MAGSERGKKSLRAFIAAIAVTALSAAGLTACAPAADAPDTQARPVSFMLSWAPDTNHIGVYVAQHKGWFARQGLAVEVLAVAKSGAEQAVNSGLADFALSSLANVATFSTKGAELTQVLQVQQKPSAIWCALAGNSAITRPRDLDGATFASFGSNESDAVVKRMIQTDGGKGEFSTVTVGTDTFRTLISGKADFGGFYATWEGVQARLHGPQLRCFHAENYGVPGNPDAIGIITSRALIAKDPQLVRDFVQAVQRGYEYAYAHPAEAAQILVQEAPEANLDPQLVQTSMATIVKGQYWGDSAAFASGAQQFGKADFAGTQQYFDFLQAAHAYVDQSGTPVATAPQAQQLATDEFLAPQS